ncbi:MAG: carbohydrate ABC transporter permease [Candidatus Bipolaricaulia bacterium]
MAPSLLFFGLFAFYPIANAIRVSLLKKDLLALGPAKFIGFKNYVSLFTSPDFWNSLKATAIFVGGTFSLLVVFSLLLAVFITSRRRLQTVLQLAYFSPAVVSSIVAASIWMLIFDPRGIANQWVNFVLNTPGVNHKWLASVGMIRLSTILVYFWKYVGFFTIIFVAGLSTIPKTLHESARIDGANSWQDFWHITFPLLRPTTLLVSIVAMIQCARTFSTQFFFTQSGTPRGPIDVITLNVYHTAIRDHQIGKASALSIILFLIMVLLSWLQFRIARSEKISY